MNERDRQKSNGQHERNVKDTEKDEDDKAPRNKWNVYTGAYNAPCMHSSPKRGASELVRRGRQSCTVAEVQSADPLI